MDDQLTIRDALLQHYAAHGLPPDGGAGRAYFIIHLGRLKIPMPNPGLRKQALLYHDIHHLLTGYNTVFSQGEMIIAGFEIGAGCGRFVAAWVINLWGFALGLFITPRQMFAAFVRGRRCGLQGCLYHHPNKREQFMTMTVSELKHELGLDRPTPPAAPADRAAFALWSAAAWLVTLACAALALVAIWAVVAVATRFIGD